MPDLAFQVEGAEVLPHAAVPTLLFTLGISNHGREPLRSVALKTQVRILTTQRPYTAEEQERLGEVFGAPERWGTTLHPLLWALTTVLVPPFTETTHVEIPVPCTYDLEVASAKYFAAVEEAPIPLEFLFSGTIFYEGPTGLQVSLIPWEKEATYRLPASLWHRLMESYFPNSAWVRVHKDVFDRLARYKRRHGLVTWEDTFERLLRGEDDEEARP